MRKRLLKYAAFANMPRLIVLPPTTLGAAAAGA
jgi:hypothetical protein